MAKRSSALTLTPPIEPMLAKLADTLPEGDYLYEPKWDGFRAIVFHSADEPYIQSRDGRPLNRYFPELLAEIEAQLPRGCVLDGEIVIVTAKGLDFDALQLRLHPAAARVKKLAEQTPAAFVAFDVLALDSQNLMSMPQRQRRASLTELLKSTKPPLYGTPATEDRKVALNWLKRFEGAGLDGVVAKAAASAYLPGKRAMVKVKHVRTADCVVAGFRWHKSGEDAIGSLLLGLYDEAGTLHHVGVTSTFSMLARRQLAKDLAPLRSNAMATHPWRDSEEASESKRTPRAQSRWSSGKNLAWEPLKITRVCEVKYDHMQGLRFRHATVFLRWRPDKPAEHCRYDQLEVIAPYELKRIFSA